MMSIYKRKRVRILCLASLVTFILYYFVSPITILNKRDAIPHNNQSLNGIYLVTNYPLMTEKPWNAFPHHNQSLNGIHLVTNYPLMTGKPWNETAERNETKLWQRQQEVEETLQRNLNYSLIAAVHLLINQPLAERRLHKINLHNKDKIVVHHIKGFPTYRNLFEYASDRLQNELVAVTNMDIYLEEGFEKVNKTYLVEQNLFYVITRHGRQEQRCNMSGKPGYCHSNYFGSHDTFIFVLTHRLDEPVLSELDNNMHVFGVENVLLWVLKSRMNKTLLNPCSYLKVYHNHCVDIHGAARTRIKVKEIVWVPFSGLYIT